MSQNCPCRNNFFNDEYKKFPTNQVKKNLISVDNISSDSGNIIVNGKLTGNNGQPVMITDIQASNYNLTHKSTGTGNSIVNFSGPGGNIRTFKSLLSSNNSIVFTGNDDQIDINGALLRMNRSIYFDTPSPNLYQIQSVYTEPSNRMNILFSNPFVATKGILNPLTITSSTVSPYFQIINLNYVGINPSPTDITENPGDGYNGNFRTDIRVQWSPHLELNDPMIENVMLLVSPLGSNGGTILNAKDSFTLFNSTNQLPNINSNFEAEINNNNPFGVWLYYNGVNAPSAININSTGHVWLYLRPFSR